MPPQYLYQMFGSGVDKAIENYRKASEDKRLLGALLLFGTTPEIIHHYRVEGRYTIGYDEKDGELVRVPLKEPIYLRVVYDDKYQTHRSNIT